MSPKDLLHKAIQSFQRRSQDRGDEHMVGLCSRALAGDVQAFSEVLISIGEALGQNESNTLQQGDGCVVDTAGGIWHPGEDALMLVGDDPEGLVALCHIAPMMGTWSS